MLVASVSKIYGEAAQLYFSSAAGKILAKAEGEARSLKDEFVSTEHLLLSLAESGGKAGDILRRAGVNKIAILSALKVIRGNQRVTIKIRKKNTRYWKNIAGTLLPWHVRKNLIP